MVAEFFFIAKVLVLIAVVVGVALWRDHKRRQGKHKD
jgi:hypothetical protein